ncbi:MAG TPA: MBL fold metallo-hydrolase [Verrucomicrobiae bacterium]|jgi:beta-lactamase superfamily II metal-dependent hydrolase|nr:MBL fold metallo-hydrolase [Verrucomicrobiae bacterium]
MFDGFEVDVLSLGDADCILVSEWRGYAVRRLLIDGGRKSDFPVVRAFLRQRNVTSLDDVLCSHLHNDHAAGLIELLKDHSIAVGSGWMHSIRSHCDAGQLRRTANGSSNDAEGVREVVENTDRLLSAFTARGITPTEPFTGSAPAILGPSQAYYKNVIAEFIKAGTAAMAMPQPGFGQLGLLAALVGAGSNRQAGTIPFRLPSNMPNSSEYGALSRLMLGAPPITGPLARSAVQENPSTQPFNNTSVIIGLQFKGKKFLFTADAGCESLRQVALGWEDIYCLQVPHHGSEGNLSKDLIARFRPQIAFVSACGDQSHPSSAVKTALITVNAKVFSTHYPSPAHKWFWLGDVPARSDYIPATAMRGSAGLPWALSG